MSTVQNTLIWRLTARGTGEVISSFNQIGSGFQRLGSQINQQSRMSERLNAQWRAMGTTIRYAIAGGTIFGLTRMASELKDIQTQLGLISAIASQPGPAGGLVGVPFSDQQITQLGNRLRQVSTDTLTPLQDIQSAALNLLSTVQGVPQDQISPMLETITKGAKLAQTPTEDLTKAITTMNIAFGQANNVRNVQQGVQRWFSLIQLAPGGVSAGPEIVQQLSPVAAVARLQPGINTTGREAQAQMMALMLGAVRTGATPSTAGRGLAFLIQSILQPKTAASKQALASMGITPEFTHREGFWPSLMKLFQHINFKGDPKALAAIPDDQLEDMGTSALKGLDPQQAELLNRAIPRIHGVRTAVILASQLQKHGQVQSLAQDYQIMLGHFNQHDKDVLLLNRAWDRFRNRSRLQEAVTAIHNMQLQVAQTFLPVLNYAARGASYVSRQAQAHPTITRDVTLAMTAAIGGAGILRFLGGGGGIRGLLRRGAGGGGEAIVRSQAVAALANTGVLGGSPLNPMYVVVVDQLFGSSARSPTGDPLSPTGPNPYRKGGSRIAGWAKKIGGPLGGLFAEGAAEIGAGTVATGAALFAAIPLLLSGGGAKTAAGRRAQAATRGGANPLLAKVLQNHGLHYDPQNYPKFHHLLTGFTKGSVTADQFENYLQKHRDVLQALGVISRPQTPRQNMRQEPYYAAQAMLKTYEIARAQQVLHSPYVTDVSGLQVHNIKGRAVVDFTVKIEQPGKKTKIVREHVPMDLWTHKAPASRGKTGKTARN
jgi:hypothetical protein